MILDERASASYYLVMGNGNSARYSVQADNENGHHVVLVHADYRGDAQAAIKLAKQMIVAAGGRFKVVFFNEVTSEYSNLVTYYRARIVYTFRPVSA